MSVLIPTLLTWTVGSSEIAVAIQNLHVVTLQNTTQPVCAPLSNIHISYSLHLLFYSYNILPVCLFFSEERMFLY